MATNGRPPVVRRLHVVIRARYSIPRAESVLTKSGAARRPGPHATPLAAVSPAHGRAPAHRGYRPVPWHELSSEAEALVPSGNVHVASTVAVAAVWHVAQSLTHLESTPVCKGLQARPAAGPVLESQFVPPQPAKQLRQAGRKVRRQASHAHGAYTVHICVEARHQAANAIARDAVVTCSSSCRRSHCTCRRSGRGSGRTLPSRLPDPATQRRRHGRGSSRRSG